ncbi:MAG: HAMP domain-containing histidine kinase [Lachnospiraceae bacterium]|nr:HAMP domain-containing histidine kinase [Lachnospiraceae bacterium]
MSKDNNYEIEQEYQVETTTQRARRRKLSGSMPAKITAFLILAISFMTGIIAVGCTGLMINGDAYHYQSLQNCIPAVAREMMVNTAWTEMHMLRGNYFSDNIEYLEDQYANRNCTVEVYEEDELLWGNSTGEETPYSFRYFTSVWVDVATETGDTATGEKATDTAMESVLKEYTFRLYVDPDFPYDDEYSTIYNVAAFLCEGRYVYPFVALGCIFVCIICFIFLMCGAGHRNDREGISPGVLTALHFDVLTMGFGIVAGFSTAYIWNFLEWNFGSEWWVIALVALAGAAIVVWCTIYCMDFAIRVKLGAWWKHTLIATVLRLIGKCVRFLWRSLISLVKGFPLILNVAISFVGICILEFMGLCLWCRSGELVVVWILEKLVLFPIVMYIALVCKKLQAGSEALAKGDLSFKLDTSKMILSFKEHGENLNQIGEGIARAVEERMKSEHLKTELITNVSHDLKTPLTSIINYADLLAFEVESDKNADDNKIREYAEVLLRQSKRLKKLLEDLVEASKATTGALEVNLEQCEIGVLLSQAVGEYEQRFAEKQLNLIVRQPEEAVRIMADGRHLWRVFDNLLNNICKYAQENTRVYLSVEKKEKQVEIIFRNMSKYALDISAEELEERFVRGDKSRHMEGNGLGLSIAKSLVELQKGRMEIVTDGDLFKVILYFEEI